MDFMEPGVCCPKRPLNLLTHLLYMQYCVISHRFDDVSGLKPDIFNTTNWNTSMFLVHYDYASICSQICVIYFPIFFRVTSTTLGQFYDCPSVSEVTLKDMGETNHFIATTVH